MIVFDLDGTLSLVGDRVRFLRQEPKDWDSFYEVCDQDKANKPIVRLCRQLSHKIIRVVTGRRESVRQKTLVWLEIQGIYIRSEDLYMRKNGDFRHDTIVKPELIEPFKNDVECIFEDRNSMVAKWRELGFCCLQVADGDF